MKWSTTTRTRHPPQEVLEQLRGNRLGRADEGPELAANRLGEPWEPRRGGGVVQLVLDEDREHEVGGEAMGLVPGHGPAGHLAGEAGLAGPALADDEPAALVARPADVGPEGGRGELRGELAVDLHRGRDVDLSVLGRRELVEVLAGFLDVGLDPGIEHAGAVGQEPDEREIAHRNPQGQLFDGWQRVLEGLIPAEQPQGLHEEDGE